MPDKECPKNLILSPPDANVLVRFVGELNGNIKFIEKSFKVKVFQNGNKLKITGQDEDVKLASDALKKLYEAAGKSINVLGGANGGYAALRLMRMILWNRKVANEPAKRKLKRFCPS